jgi:hypothetical protein
MNQEWEQSMGDNYNGNISDDEDGNTAYLMDIGHISILDNESVATMKSLRMGS